MTKDTVLAKSTSPSWVKLRAIADFLDEVDAERGVTEHAVQDWLREYADQIEAAWRRVE